MGAYRRWAELRSWNISQLNTTSHMGKLAIASNEVLSNTWAMRQCQLLGQLAISSSSLSQALLICCSKAPMLVAGWSWANTDATDGRNPPSWRESSKLEGNLQVDPDTIMVEILQVVSKAMKNLLIWFPFDQYFLPHCIKLPSFYTSFSTPPPHPK